MEITTTEVAIVGAGPYGLSVAAHLRSSGVHFAIYGKPMHTWLSHMPLGMELKSEPFSSNLYCPGPRLSLQDYYAEQGLPYQAIGSPVALETFAKYGLEFQRRLVPELDTSEIVGISRSDAGFILDTADGRRCVARRVVLAVGITHFGHLPEVLRGLPAELVTHSSQESDPARFSGRKVVVVGAGASAIDLAVLMHEAGAQVELVARAKWIAFHPRSSVNPRPLLQRLRAPRSGLGIGWKSRLCQDAPLVFHALPEKVRARAVKRHLGPAPSWFMRRRFEGSVATRLGTTIEAASVEGNQVRLTLFDGKQERSELLADHVVSATGYEVDLERLTFLAPELRGSISQAGGSPLLSRNFEASVPGLFMVGLAAANSFGPLLRFACGAEFAAKRLSKHLTRQARRMHTKP